MVRARFEHQIETLNEDLLRLGSMVELALSRAIKSLATNDSLMASWIIEDDLQINYARYSVEEQAITLLATQQPVARDLRFLSVVTAIAVELERIGDYASVIARRVERISRRKSQLKLPPLLHEMCELTQSMLHTSLEAFLHQDRVLTYSLDHNSNRVYEYEGILRSKLIDVARNQPEYIETVIDLLDVIHALERVGDRATNIGERVIYLVASVVEEMDRPHFCAA